MGPDGLCAIGIDPLKHTPHGPKRSETYPAVRPSQGAAQKEQRGAEAGAQPGEAVAAGEGERPKPPKKSFRAAAHVRRGKIV